MRKILIALGVLFSVLLGTAGAASALVYEPGLDGAANVCNVGTYQLGVVHVPKPLGQTYALGHYDGILQPGQCSKAKFGWPHTGGVWISANYGEAVYDANGHLLLSWYGPENEFFDNGAATYKVEIFNPGFAPFAGKPAASVRSSDCTSCHGRTSATTAAVQPGNYAYNPNAFTIEVYQYPLDQQQPRAQLGSGKSTDVAPLNLVYVYGTYMAPQRCFRIYYTPHGELGWHFWHQYYDPYTPKAIEFSTNYDYKIVVGAKGAVC